jgi:DNA repair exonuclease SbcCD ATPase subunit
VITFKTVRFKNFGSFGNTFTEINLNKNNTTLVCGSNGNGKSFAFLDSISFALFGKPFRNMNIPQLVNSINKKNCVVELEFSIGKTEYKIVRGLAPKVFKIYKDDELLNEDAKSKDYQKILEEQIVGMNHKTFSQVVVLGSSSFIPFMQLTPADRRLVIENILDIGIFSEMNGVLKTKIGTAKGNLQAVESELLLVNEKVSATKEVLESYQRNTSDRVADRKKTLEENTETIKALSKEIKALQKTMKELEVEIEPGDQISAELKKQQIVLFKLESTIEGVQEDIKFFEKNQSCPTCKQTISKEHKETVIAEKTEKTQEHNRSLERIKEAIGMSKNNLNKITSVQNKLNDLIIKASAKEQTVESLVKLNQKLDQEMVAVVETADTQAKIQEAQDRLSDLLSKQGKLLEKKQKALDTLRSYDKLVFLFKDSGIKAKIVKYYIPLINKYVNKYLNNMDFYANFHLDEEFNEVIKSRHRDEFCYESFSEGEKMRIDLALLLTWREIAKLKNSVNTNLLILDEVFDSSLDSGGVDELMKLLSSFGARANVYVISHKTDQLLDRFNHVVQFDKKKNFSRIV